MFFFDKKNKKLLPGGAGVTSGTYTSGHDGAGAKVFCFLFSKKKAFLTCLLAV
jgi:hypothetical protein